MLLSQTVVCRIVIDVLHAVYCMLESAEQQLHVWSIGTSKGLHTRTSHDFYAAQRSLLILAMKHALCAMQVVQKDACDCRVVLQRLQM
jgi:hypothetical protein